MKLSDLEFDYPEHLVATKRASSSRVMHAQKNGEFVELNKQNLLDSVQPGDLLVVNDTKVLQRKVTSECGLDVLFVDHTSDGLWSVLFPAKKVKIGQAISMPGALSLALVEKGIPQKVRPSMSITEDYFFNFGRMAIPPYIEKARKSSNEVVTPQEDSSWYQTDWAENQGSCAAPTASLHFSNKDLSLLKGKGVNIARVTLHVGLGTFLPIRSDNILNHQMHFEQVVIQAAELEKIRKTKNDHSGRIWALGTTVARTLESIPRGYFSETIGGGVAGSTDLFLYPGVEFKYVDVLMTNFHQPGSTLMALVSAFAGVEKVQKGYDWAIKNEFKLFSYGDLSVWER